MILKRIAVFASGNGSNFEMIARGCLCGSVPARIEALVVDKPDAKVIRRAAAFPNIEVIVLDPKQFPSKKEYEEEIVRRLAPFDLDLICLAGYMRIVGPTLLSHYPERIINIHPSLLPSFKGAHAIRDAFEFGVKVFGVTIHYVDETLDGGRIISQAAVPYEGDDLDELEGMIHQTEYKLYVNTIARLLRD